MAWERFEKRRTVNKKEKTVKIDSMATCRFRSQLLVDVPAVVWEINEVQGLIMLREAQDGEDGYVVRNASKSSFCVTAWSFFKYYKLMHLLRQTLPITETERGIIFSYKGAG